MTLDQRIEALTMSLRFLTRDVKTLRDSVGVLRDAAEQLVTAVRADGEHIRALVRIAEIRG